jgi:hypothetical protein
MTRDEEDLIATETLNNLKKFNFMLVKVEGYSIYVKGRDDIKQRMAINLIKNMLKEQLPQAQLLVKWI